MIEKTVTKEECTGCGVCREVCPAKCINFEYDVLGFKLPSIDTSSCIECNMCDKVCPILVQKNLEYPKKAYAGINKDKKIVFESSSGGAFSALAQTILEQGGIIYGAVMNKERNVEHIAVERLDELGKLRKAKYVQSEIESIYSEAYNNVIENRKVLFCGTPCQAQAFANMFEHKYENLCIVEFICHGVSSSKLLKMSLDNLEKKNNFKIKNIEFHSKRKSWRSNTVSITTDEGCNREFNSFDFPFLYGFIKNIILRESCYTCKFRRELRASDIIIADFWEIRRVAPQYDNYEGVSMLFSLTEKGNQIIQQASDYMYLHPVDCEKLILYKKNLKKLDYDDSIRKKFLEDFIKRGYMYTERKYLNPERWKKPLKKIKDIIFLKLKLK